MTTTLKIADLSDTIFSYKGTEVMAVRRSCVLPSYHPRLKVYKLTIPRRVWEVSYQIYGTPDLWIFLADLNGVANPTKFFYQYIPANTVIRYLTTADIKLYYQGLLKYDLHGAGEVDLAPTIPGVTYLE